MTLGQLLGCDEDEAQSRMALRANLAAFGHYWAKDFEDAASRCDDAAAGMPLDAQPQFAFVRGQALAYRRIAADIRAMEAANAAVYAKLAEQQGEMYA